MLMAYRAIRARGRCKPQPFQSKLWTLGSQHMTLRPIPNGFYHMKTILMNSIVDVGFRLKVTTQTLRRILDLIRMRGGGADFHENDILTQIQCPPISVST